MKRRRWPWVFTIMAVVVVVGVAAAVIFRGPPPEAAPGDPRQANESSSESPRTTLDAEEVLEKVFPEPVTADVGYDVFHLEVGSVEVSGDSDVVGTSTQITAKLVESPTGVEDQTEGLLKVQGTTVELNFADGSQPQTPVQIAFNLSGVNSHFDETEYPIVASESADGSIDYIESVWDPATKTLTAQTEHFSRFSVFFMNFNKTMDSLVNGVQRALSIRENPPSCYYDGPEAGDGHYLIDNIRGQMVWPCLKEEAGELTVELYANSPIPWEVDAGGATRVATPTVTSASGSLTLALQRQVRGVEDYSAVVPGGKAEIVFEPGYVDFDIRANPLFTVTHTMAEAVMLIPGVKLIDAAGWAQCGTDALIYATDSSDVPQLFKTVLGCFGQGIGGLPGLIVSAVAAAPAIIAANVTTLLGAALDKNSIEISIKPNDAGVSKGTLPAGLEGKWFGKSQGEYSIENMSITLKQTGENITAYAREGELNCTAALHFSEVEGNKSVFFGSMTGGTCIADGFWKLWPEGDKLRFEYAMSDLDFEPEKQGTLTKQ